MIFKRLFLSVGQFFRFAILLALLCGGLLFMSVQTEDQYLENCRSLGISCDEGDVRRKTDDLKHGMMAFWKRLRDKAQQWVDSSKSLAE